MANDLLRSLPSVDALLQDHTLRDLEHRYGHTLVREACRGALDAARQAIRAGGDAPMPALIVDDVCTRVEHATRSTLVPVINATGVILHTNLGRAPLSADAIAAMRTAAQGYTNLEYDLDSGERGSRHTHAQELLMRLTGAPAALVVNNNAAAVLLILAGYAAGREVVISRGELVEIGGGFRVPDVLRQSGATLVEVGTTNRTRIDDYARALSDKTALVLRVHPSNFRIIGFTEQPSLTELVALGRERGIPVVDDLGSGALLDTGAYGLAHEPMPQEALAAGVSLVSISGDKLLGGPQAGIILGTGEAIDKLKRHPLTRALRVDKVTLAGLQATLLHYAKNEAPARIPIWMMIAARRDDLEARAVRWVERLRGGAVPAEIVDALSTIGGGSLPGETLPTRAVALAVHAPDDFAARLRRNVPPIVGRIDEGRLLLDPRTVPPADEEAMLAGVLRVAQQST